MSEMPENPHALPSIEPNADGSPYFYNPGMSLRDWFAGQIVERCLLNALDSDGGWDPSNVAYHAYLMADAMLAERAKQNGERE